MRSNRRNTLLTIAIVAAGVMPIGLGAVSALPQVRSSATTTARFDAASVSGDSLRGAKRGELITRGERRPHEVQGAKKRAGS